MGIKGLLWKRSLNDVALYLVSRGYEVKLMDSGATDSYERFKLRITSQGGFVDLYSRNRIWMFDKLDVHGELNPERTMEILQDRRDFPFRPLPANAGPISIAEALLHGFVVFPVPRTPR